MQNTVLFIAIHSESFTFADKRHTELASYKLSNYEIIVFIWEQNLDNFLYRNPAFYEENKVASRTEMHNTCEKGVDIIGIREKESSSGGVYSGTPLVIWDSADSSY